MNSRLAILAGAAVVVIAVLIGGDQVPGCLGPLGAGSAECAAGIAAKGEPWAPGPGAGSAVLIGIPLIGFVFAVVPWQRLDRVARVLLALAASVGALIGAVYYDSTRPTSITHTNELNGVTTTAPLAANADLRILTGLFGAAVIGIGAAWLLALVSSRETR